MLKKLTHKHNWKQILANRYGTVERCPDCGEFQTTMQDLSTGEPTTVPGNLLALAYGNFYILCGTEEEYKEAVSQLRDKLEINEEQCRRLYKPEQVDGWIVPPIIYCWGTWWENEVIQSETVRKALNGWL